MYISNTNFRFKTRLELMMNYAIGKKIMYFQKIMKQVSNWYIIPLTYFGLRRRDTILHLKTGHRLKLRANSTDFFTFVNVWIIEEYKREGFEINENDTIIDVGGHIGIFSVYASRFCRNGQILCFEPVLENYNTLRSEEHTSELQSH